MHLEYKDGDAKITLKTDGIAYEVELTAESGKHVVWNKRTIHKATAMYWFMRGIADELGSYGDDYTESVMIEGFVLREYPVV